MQNFPGDVLVYVNETCVLGYKQDEIIRLFQVIPVGMTVQLQVCRGYPLLFDPADPANDFVVQDAYLNTMDDDAWSKPPKAPPSTSHHWSTDENHHAPIGQNGGTSYNWWACHSFC